jgi:hypothetical protein
VVLWLCFLLYWSSFSRYRPIAIRWHRTVYRALQWSAHLIFGSAHGAMKPPHSLAGLDLGRWYRSPLCRVSARQLLSLWTTSPGGRTHGMSFNSTIGLPTCLKSSCLKRGLLRGMTCGWRSPYEVGIFSKLTWGCGVVRFQGPTPSSCC